MLDAAFIQRVIEKFRDSGHIPTLSHKRILFILILSGFLINAYFAFKLSLWHDEAITANAAISFLQNGVPEFHSGFEYWRSFPHTLLVAASGYIFGVSDFTLRLPSIIFGCLTLALIYLVGKEFFDRDVGLVASALLTFSAWQVAWASQVRMYALFQFLYLASVFLIYLSVERGDKKYVLGLLIAIILAIRTHVTGQILPFIAIAYWFYRNQDSNLYLKISLPALTLASIAALELFSIESFIGVLRRFTFKPENIHFYYDTVFKEIPIFSVLGFSGSIIGFKKNLNSNVLAALAVFPALYVYIVHVNGVSIRYIFFSAPLVAIWAGLSIKFLSEKISEKLSKNTSLENPKKALIILIATLAILIGSGLDFNFSNGDYRIDNDEESVYSYIQSEGSSNNTLITQWTPAATYYYKAPDYSLYGDKNTVKGYNSTFYREEYEFNGTEIHSGAKFIDSNEELVKIINRDRQGWIVLRGFSYWKKSKEIRGTISELEAVQKFTETNIKEDNSLNVWRWNSSTELEK